MKNKRKLDAKRHCHGESENKEALVVCTIFVEAWNMQNHSDFRNPILGSNPPDAISTDNHGNELWMEVTEFNSLQKAAEGKRDFTAREVNPIGTLIKVLKNKDKKCYEPAFRSKLILLLKGDLVSDRELEEHEKQEFFKLSLNKNELRKLGFKGIWYISQLKKKALKIFNGG